MIILGLKREKGKYSKRTYLVPALSEKDEFVKETDIRFPTLKILLSLSSLFKKKRVGVYLRRCEEKALKELKKEGQLEGVEIEVLPLGCSEKLIEACGCIHYGKMEMEELPEDYGFWKREFHRCIKCMACTENCPLCYCKRCVLLDEIFVEKGAVPPSYPIFHLIRLFHLSLRCTQCNLCHQSCPALIDLRYLNGRAARIFEEKFNYRPGSDSQNPLTLP